MNYNPFQLSQYKEYIKKIDEEIKKENNKEKVDRHRIYRLEEEKAIGGLFSDMNIYKGYRRPW